MNLLVDSNVALDFLARRQPFYSSARKLFIFAVMGDYDLWMSSSQATDLFYVLRHSGLSAEEAKDKLLKFFSKVHICSVAEDDVLAALESTWDDAEDALVHRVAQKVGATALITRNKKDFQASFVKVFDAEEFFGWMESSKGLRFEEIDF